MSVCSGLKCMRTCPCCQRKKSTNQKPAGLLQPLPVPTREWGSISIDLITALPETASLYLGLMICLINCRDHSTSLALMLPLAFIRSCCRSQTDQRQPSKLHLDNTDSEYYNNFLASPTSFASTFRATPT